MILILFLISVVVVERVVTLADRKAKAASAAANSAAAKAAGADANSADVNSADANTPTLVPVSTPPTTFSSELFSLSQNLGGAVRPAEIPVPQPNPSGDLTNPPQPPQL